MFNRRSVSSSTEPQRQSLYDAHLDATKNRPYTD
jgi:hypothetical protein